MDTNTTPPAPVTVAQILARYERDCLPDLGPRTQDGYRRHIAHLNAVFGERIASELKPRDFGPFLDVRKGRVHRVRELAVLSAAFTQAVSFWYILDRNVLRDVKRPRFKPRDRLILDDEFEGCKSIAPKRVRLAMQLAVITGQRQGDIISFKWSDIEDLPEPIYDERSKDWITMELNVVQGKTGKRIGIGISKQLEAVLDECYRLPGGGKDGSAYVLPTKFREPYTSDGFRACWQRVIKKWVRLGNKNFHFHDIRALCATKCPSIEYAQKLLGHSSPAMTSRIYRRGKERVMPLQIATPRAIPHEARAAVV